VRRGTCNETCNETWDVGRGTWDVRREIRVYLLCHGELEGWTLDVSRETWDLRREKKKRRGT